MTDRLRGYGAALSVTDELAEHAHAAERWGYSAVWLPGGALASLEPLLEILRATTRVAVVPGIIPLDVHGVDAITALYAEAERIGPGRLVAGVGGQVGIAVLRQAADALGAAVPRERTLLAALGPRKLDLARDRFGGAVTLLVTPDHTSWAKERLGGSTLVVEQMVVLDEDPRAARAAAREPLGFLAAVPGYAATFSRMGFGEAHVADLSDGLVDATFAWGGADRVAARLREQAAEGADHVVVDPLVGPGEPKTLERLATELALA